MSDLNTNYLQNITFEFRIKKLPHVEYFGTAVEIPGVSLGSIEYGTGGFTDLQIPGDQMVFEPLNITFQISENLDNYIEVMNWMIQIGTPRTKDVYGSQKLIDKLSDASVILFTSQKNPHMEVQFKDIFPTTISGIQLDTKQDGIVVSECTVTFSYTDFILKPIKY